MEESKWEITTNYIDGKKLYGVYRIIDINEVDHSGNREVKGYYDSREKAEEIAEELNSMNDDTFWKKRCKGGQAWLKRLSRL